MSNRRAFLRKFGLGLGVMTIGAEPAAAFFYQKKSILRNTAPPEPPQAVDFRYAPGDWRSPVRYPGGEGQTFIGRTGGLARTPGAGSIGLFIDGAGEMTSLSQSCEEPHIPFLRTTLSYGSSRIELTAFSAFQEDEGETDNITILAKPDGAPLTLRLVVRSGGRLESSIEKDDDLPRGAVCTVFPEGERDHPFLILNAEPAVTRDGDALTLTVHVAPGESAAAEPILLRIPRGESDAGEIASGFRRIEERAASERERWSAWKSQRSPAGWDLPGIYGEFSVASARIIDQLSAPAPPAAGDRMRPAGTPSPVSADSLPDLVDEHFISEAELYLGREKEARARLEAVWRLEDDRGMLIGAGGESNMKEQCAAVYSLCRHAELTGDWAMFDELYPDAFNAMDALRRKRDGAAALKEQDPNAMRNILPTGSPGPGWPAVREELTNTLWALITLKLLLEISDRRFLVKKSETREFYGQLRLAYVNAVRGMLKADPAGVSSYPMVGEFTTGSADGVPRPQRGLGTLALGHFPGLLFKAEDAWAANFPALVKASLREDVPAGTGPGPAESVVPVDAVLAAQALVWFKMPEDARGVFVGFLNHASPVFTWNAGARPGTGGTAESAAVDLRASAECIRFMRHAMVMEDVETLRLFEGIARADLVPGRRLAVDRTPTRWGRVSVALEPVDSRTWKVVFSREPGASPRPPELKSVEMPRALAPNFRFDTIKPGTAIKNGPRVIIDAQTLAWEALLRDLRRF